ncbi:hypothetical protein [Chakrabartyella piscis]|uniref:hypothetical protein n=1 Tax=Chakrabartyella piscis TaxID=2918914 RepID=UPI0029586E33|nr:hypothetical protein [Chakrabartyella piscis]
MKEICTKCGSAIDSLDVFCSGCGRKIDRSHNIHTPKQSIDNEPLTIGKCLLGLLLLVIPVVNLICLLIWAFSSNSNTNVKNIARALLLAVVICTALLIFGAVQCFFELQTFFSTPPAQIEETIPSIPWKHLDIPFDVSYL